MHDLAIFRAHYSRALALLSSVAADIRDRGHHFEKCLPLFFFFALSLNIGSYSLVTLLLHQTHL